MSSKSPGDETPSTFHQILPGATVPGLQSITTLIFRWKRYLFYISKLQLNVLRSANEFVQAVECDEELVAVIAEPGDNGRIALASTSKIWLLKPVTSTWNRVTWAKELLLEETDRIADNHIRSLSWSNEGELLVGGSKYLVLYNTSPASRVSSPIDEQQGASAIEQRQPLWSKSIASPILDASFSPSANLIASTAIHDCLVKIWRRLSFEEAIFDFAYLPHEGIVTHLEWRASEPAKLEIGQEGSDRRSVSSYHGGDEHCEVLYTLASDAQLRIWRTNSHQDLDMLSLYTIIDLVSAIPHSPVLQTRTSAAQAKPARYTFILPSYAYEAATAVVLKKQPQGKLRHSLEHLREVSSREPDVVVVIDAQGRMSAWGVSSVGHKRRPGSAGGGVASPFHIAHSDDMGLPTGSSEASPATFNTWFDGDTLNVLMHSFTDGIKWWQSNIEDFSSSAAISDERGRILASLSGVQDTVSSMRTSGDLRDLLVWSQDGELLQLQRDLKGEQHSRRSLQLDGSILAADTVQRGKSLLVLKQDGFVLVRDTANNENFLVKHDLDHKQLAMVRVEDRRSTVDETYLVYSSTGRFCVVNVNPTRADWQSKEAILQVINKDTTLPILDASSDQSESLKNFKALVHPRKAGWLRLVATSSNGVLYRRDIDIDAQVAPVKGQIEEQTLIFDIGCQANIVDATPNYAALLSDRSLLIVDLKDGYVELSQKVQTQAHALVFARPAYEDAGSVQHSLLAVAHTSTVDILARSRHVQGDQQQWSIIKSVSTTGTGLDITSIEWLSTSQLAIAAGGSILISDNILASKHLEIKTRQTFELSEDRTLSLSEMVEHLNGPVVCWNAQLLRMLITSGFFRVALNILRELQDKLRFFTNGDQLDSLLGLDVEAMLKETHTQQDSEIDLSSLGDQLDELDLPDTSDEEQDRLKVVLRAAVFVQRHLQSLDDYAVRYLFDWRYRVLADAQTADGDITNGSTDSADNKVVPQMKWREITYAYHSETQQPLMEVLIQYYENKLDWHMVGSLGIALWLHNIKAAQSEGAAMASLEQIFDALGQNAYRASYPPNPADSSLFLLALRKKAVLLSLWRVANGNREQKSTSNFLKRDFNQEENRVAARKNAYALMGKRRFQYAAAFFLLADDVLNAISLLAGQCNDLPLAVAVARAYSGDDSTIAHAFLQDRVVSQAKRCGDRWMLHWAYHISGQVELSAQALVSSFDIVMAGEQKAVARSWRQDDPAATVTYRELRDASRRAATVKKVLFQVPVTDEYRAVLRSARILRRQGLWLLALQLTSRWHFIRSIDEINSSGTANTAATETAVNGEPASSLLDSFGTAKAESVGESASTSTDHKVTADEPDATPAPAQDRAAKAAELLAKMRAKKQSPANDSPAAASEGQKAPTQFKEPAANSLLDSFGF